MDDILVQEFEEPSDPSDAFKNLSDALESLEILEIEDWAPLEGVEGIEKKVLESGLELVGIGEKDVALCHYSLTIDGEVEPYDSSLLRRKRERLTLGTILPGVEFALLSMKKCERSAFRIQPGLAFGALGCPPRIPANSVILAEIKVFDFLDSKSSKELLRRPQELAYKYSFRYVYDLIHREYLEANNNVKRGEFALATGLYQGGIKLFEILPVKDDKEDAERKILLHKLRLNVGLCFLQTGKYAPTCGVMREVLADEPDNVRALYRMGKAKRMLGGIEEARSYLKRALSHAPGDPDIRRELGNLRKDIQQRKKYEMAISEGLFQSQEKTKRKDK
uniref:peptidylprolyl isomerase n=1 Tax=Caligus clemensi TaxID=344056 RepID=C1C122_CALCM|nr:FK506-binding protein 6 [Caligus clemensi]